MLVIHPSHMKLWELMNSYKVLSQREILVEEVRNKQQIFFPEFSLIILISNFLFLSQGICQSFCQVSLLIPIKTPFSWSSDTVKTSRSQKIPRKLKGSLERKGLSNFFSISIRHLLICMTDLQTSEKSPLLVSPHSSFFWDKTANSSRASPSWTLSPHLEGSSVLSKFMCLKEFIFYFFPYDFIPGEGSKRITVLARSINKYSLFFSSFFTLSTLSGSHRGRACFPLGLNVLRKELHGTGWFQERHLTQ